MPPPAQLSATVLICTYNRDRALQETLESLRTLVTTRPWDITVVDNNSRDRTRAVVRAFAETMTVPVSYMFEPQQGKSHALNAGVASSHGEVIAFTDDDVRVSPEWLDEACRPLEEDRAIDYTGGPVRPLWESSPPAWLDQGRGDLWGTLAILDYGRTRFVFEDRCRVPLGVNMAVRRSLMHRIGGFHPELGRRGASLLGQEQAEFLARARALGAHGQYQPRMEVWHHVPAARLTKRYFRRWWYWKGVSRARVDAIHLRTELGLDLRTVPRITGVPRFVWGQIPREALKWAVSVATGDRHAAMRHQMHLVYSAGYIHSCWSGEPLTPVAPPPTRAQAAPLAQ